jgi:hypothetical protein
MSGILAIADGWNNHFIGFFQQRFRENVSL